MAVDQDALDHFEPIIAALQARIEALEERPEAPTDAVAVHPIAVTNTYADQPPAVWRLEE